MRNSTCLFAAALAAAGLSAQDPSRPEVQLDSGSVDVQSIAGYAEWKIETPKQNLPGDPAQGLAPTARVAYALYPDRNAQNDDALFVRVSDDGGWSWGSPIEIWTADFFNGETIDGDIHFDADGHSAWVVLTTNRDETGTATSGDDYCWVVATDDQGQTWQTLNVSPGVSAPLSTGVDLNDVDAPRLAVSNGIAYVCFEADYDDTGSGAPANAEGVFFQAAQFDAGGNLVAVFPEEQHVETVAPGTTDVDDPQIDAFGQIGCIAFKRDDTGFNDTYSVTTNDGGATWNAEINHTNFAQAPNLNRRSKCAVDGPNVYIVLENDAPTLGNEDDVQIAVSNDGGNTFTSPVIISKSPAGIDSDGTAIVAQNGRIFVFYNDDRNGTGNADNDTYCVIDRNAGADFLAGTQPEVQVLDTPGGCALYAADGFIDGNGEGYVVVGCESSSFPEANSVSITSDDGNTWTRFDFVSGPDTDDVDTCVTLNGDVMSIYAHDGGANNSVYTRGTKLGLLSETTTGLRYSLGSPASVNDLALFLPSLAPPTSNGLSGLRGAMQGVAYNFTADSLTLAAASNIGPFTVLINAQGQADLPIPNFAALIGQPIYWIVATADTGAAPNQLSREYTDPYEQN